MSELRQNLATKEWVIVASERAKRPHEFVVTERKTCGEGPVWDASCPFCPGNEEADLEVLRTPNSGQWQVRIVGNRYPALTAGGDLERQYAGLIRRISGFGYHEIIVEAPEHNTCAALQHPTDVARVFRTFIERAWMVQRDPRIEYILFFKNHGPQAGASLIHPHAQMMALPMVPMDVRVRADGARNHFDEVGTCVFCEILQQELEAQTRIIAETDHFVAFAPYASVSPFHIWVMPRTHLASFFHIPADEVEDLGRIMHTVLRKLYVGLRNPDYNYVIRTAPVRDLGAPYLHWYITVVPRVSLAAGFELGSGIFINASLPEECAEFLRQVDVSQNGFFA
ncbi:MAG: galactose-1-phosphate uridylyltransferase [Caldilineaceae bacterium]|nr:galactose-1-phosphate uridylyltransferase [Caldilineaceae bacterium]